MEVGAKLEWLFPRKAVSAEKRQQYMVSKTLKFHRKAGAKCKVNFYFYFSGGEKW